MAKKSTDDRNTIKSTTPIGTITFSHLTEPDYTFDKNGNYNVKLRLTAEQAEPLLTQAHSLIEEEYEKAKAACKTKLEVSKLKLAEDLPIKVELDENAEETGYYILGAKMKASGETKEGKPWSRRPMLFDAGGNPITDLSISIWGGTEARVSFEMSAFNVPSLGIGVSCRLLAVQIVKLVSGSQKSAEDFGFGAVEGGYTAEAEMPIDHTMPTAPEQQDDNASNGDF